MELNEIDSITLHSQYHSHWILQSNITAIYWIIRAGASNSCIYLLSHNLDGVRFLFHFVSYFVDVIWTIPTPPSPDKYFTFHCVSPRILSPCCFSDIPFSNILIGPSTKISESCFSTILRLPFVKRTHHRSGLQPTFRWPITSNYLD